MTTVVSLWHRRLVVALVDGAAWVVALPLATWIRYEFDATHLDGADLATLAAIALVTLWALDIAVHAYHGRHAVGSLEDVRDLTAKACLVGSIVMVVLLDRVTPSVPRSVPLTAVLLAVTLSVCARLVVRHSRAMLARPDHALALRVIIYGAGVRGQRLARSMLADRAGGHLPVAFLDDDPRLRRCRIAGVDVRGSGVDLTAIVGLTGARLLVIASHSVTAATTRRAAVEAMGLGLEVKLLPPVNELFRPWVGAADLRDLDIADLLCRQPVETDLAAIAGCLTGRRVLVTGAGGSIGSELCRQIHSFEPAELIMLDRDESALHAVQLSIHGANSLDSPDLVLADIRDTVALRTAFAIWQPEVVFHAAALKHLAILEHHPQEAWQTNVLGTAHVLEAAVEAGVRTFVNISTDKAANPVCVLGRSKRIGERLVAAAAGGDRLFLSVRFGNVLGSRGSVLTTFAEQLATGGPLTVSHPDVTRYFMLVSEAVQLVVQAAAIGRPGEALVLDMGAPVRITELAQLLMMVSGRQARIVYTGLYDGEKLHEDLFGAGERDIRPIHSAISHIVVPGLDLAVVRTRGAQLGGAAAMVDLLREPERPTPERPTPGRPLRLPTNAGRAATGGSL